MKRLLLAQVGFLTVAALYWMQAPKSYRATSELFVHKQAASFERPGSYVAVGQINTQLAGTVARSIEGHSFLSAVVAKHPELDLTAALLADHLSTATEFSTGRVELYFDAPRPEVAEAVLAALIDDRIRADAAAVKVSRFRTQAVAQNCMESAARELDAANLELTRYCEEKQWNPGRGDLSAQLQRAMEKLHLENVSAEMRSALLDGKLQLLQNNSPSGGFLFIGFEGEALERDAVLSSLWVSRGQLAGELASLDLRYGPRHPLRDRTEVRMERVKIELQSRLEEQKGDLANWQTGLENAIGEIDKRLIQLSGEASLLRAGSLDPRYSELRAKRAGLQTILEAARTNLLALETADKIHLPRFFVFTPPHSSPLPTSPNPLVILVVGQVCAFTVFWATSSSRRM